MKSSLSWGNLTQRWSVVSTVTRMVKGQAWLLKMRPIYCPQISVTNYWSTLCNIPEERIAHLCRNESLKSPVGRFSLVEWAYCRSWVFSVTAQYRHFDAWPTLRCVTMCRVWNREWFMTCKLIWMAQRSLKCSLSSMKLSWCLVLKRARASL
jgi:hypothetical protein